MAEPSIDPNAELLALSESETFQDQQRVHEIFTRLRRDDPVAWTPEPFGGPGFWSVTKYDDIQFVSKNPKLFSSDQLLGGITLESPQMRANREGRDLADDEISSIFQAGRSMIAMDPPDHNAHRRMVAPGFTPQKLDDLEPRIRRRCVEIFDRIASQNQCEFVSSIAAELPIQMLAELLGVEQDRRHDLFNWSNIIIGADDPDIATSRDHVITAFTDMINYAVELHAERLESPGPDLLSMLVHTEVDGKPMDMADYISAFILLVVAGNETTRNAASGGLMALIENPAEFEKLRANPGLIDTAVEEIVRWTTPVIQFCRTATQDMEMRDQKVSAGEALCLFYPSANRDEDVFEDPQRFDVTREPNHHLAFGHGAHFCLGANLARVELRAAIRALLPILPDMELVDAGVRVPHLHVPGFRSLSVRYTAA